jgi:phage baseplate assembly protein W
MAVKTPHFVFPFRVLNGSVVVVEQDSEEDIRQCIYVSLATREGSRMEDPDYGVPDQLFKKLAIDPNADAVLAAVEDDEPRAALVGSVEIEDTVERVAVKRVVANG